jgi:predicted NAD/FAD-dependent oxidoreductase
MHTLLITTHPSEAPLAANPAVLNTTHTGLFFAGDYTVGLGRIHLAIKSGQEIADAIASWLQ